VTALSRAEIGELGVTIGLQEIARLTGASVRTIEDQRRNGRLERDLGIRMVKVGPRWQAATDQVLEALGITRAPAGAPDPGPGVDGATADAFAAAVLEALGRRLLAAAGAITEHEARSAPGRGGPIAGGMRQGRRLRAAGGGDGTA
jgi:hypothetical protein